MQTLLRQILISPSSCVHALSLIFYPPAAFHPMHQPLPEDATLTLSMALHFSSQQSEGVGFLVFTKAPHSDHRALYVDLDEKLLFQDSSTDPTAPSHRLLRLSNPGQCAKYLGAVNEYLTSHKVFDRLNLLVHLNLSNNSLQKFKQLMNHSTEISQQLF